MSSTQVPDTLVQDQIIPAREKADSEGLRRFESDGVDSLRGEPVMP